MFRRTLSWLSVDGSPARTKPPKLTGSDEWEIEVPIPGKDCTIGIFAENRNGPGETVWRQIKWIGPKDEERGDLYVLAIGVSSYEGDALKEGVKHAAQDAVDFAKCMGKQQDGRLYRDVKVTVLPDEKATRSEIIGVLDKMADKATVNDVVLVFLSGHGTKYKQRYYRFMLTKAAKEDEERLDLKYLEGEDILKLMANCPARRIVFLDTCHSGSIADVSGFANQLASSDSGVIVLTSSSGNQASVELKENGAFTKALLEGLTGEAADTDGFVWVLQLLRTAAKEVRRLTGGTQQPSITAAGAADFPLAEPFEICSHPER